MDKNGVTIALDICIEDRRFVVSDRWLKRVGVGKTLGAAMVEWAERFDRRAKAMRDLPPFADEVARLKQETIKALLEAM